VGYSGIGGQAVIEGVMMKNGEQVAVAVRTPDGGITVQRQDYAGWLSGSFVRRIPFFRGVVGFVDSLVLGMKTLLYSASFYEEDEKPESECEPEQEKKKEKFWMGATVAFSVVAAVFLFMLIPYFLSRLIAGVVDSGMVVALSEGALRLFIFLAYLYLISRMEDIQRVFMYHGAEHKCINCIEHGMDLTVENVQKSSRLHKRCGTSFLFLVICISIVFFLFIRTDSAALRLVSRLVLVPVVAGVAYEFLRLAGRSDNWLVNLLSRPGMALQRITTREPDESMIEVGIASVEAVFDWKAFVAKTGPGPGGGLDKEVLHDISGGN